MKKTLLLILASLSSSTAVLHAADTPAKQPNILLILADDLGWGDVQCYNPQSKILTPHLDRLAAQGLRFTDAHSSSGVCVPSRFSLMTGLHAFRMQGKGHSEPEFRHYGGNQSTVPLVPANRPTLPGILAQSGYATVMVGKWHLGFDDLLRKPTEPLRGGPTDRGFQRYFGIPSSLDIDPYVFIEGDRIAAQATEDMPAHASSGWPDDRMGEYWRPGKAAPGFRHGDVLERCTQRVEVELARLAAQTNQTPFFVYYAMPSPHSPLLPSEAFRGRTKIGIYGDYVAQTDDAVGRILRVLEGTGMADDTLVIVASDNGPFWYSANVEETGHAAAGPWRGMKGDAWEGGHRIPFIARWPGHVPAGTSDALISQTDLLVTVAALLGLRADDIATDGVDFSPALLGQAWTRPEQFPLVARSSAGANVLRNGSWKFISQLGSGGFSKPQNEKPVDDGPTVQLYELSCDPHESQNLAAAEPQRVIELRQQLQALLMGKPLAQP